MASTIYNLTNYYNLFSSPVSSYKVNPVTNLIYGATAGRIYSQSFAKQAQSTVSSYLTSMSSNASSLKASAKPLAAKDDSSSFEQKAVTSSDNSSVSGTASADAKLKDYTLSVSKLAKSQTNTGSILKSNDSSIYSSGKNSFTLKTGDGERNISFFVGDSDTNKTSLESMARSINNSKAGVTAAVFSDTKSNTSYLKIISDETGTDNGFSLYDSTGNAIALSGIAATSEQAQNAQYKLNGAEYSSQSNTINLDNGNVKITLKKADNTDIKLTTVYDTNAIKSDIDEFVKNYNSTISYTNKYLSDFEGAKSLQNELGSIMTAKTGSLGSIGIYVNSDNTLTLDDKKLTEAIKNDLWKVKDTFSGYSGVADKAYYKSNEILYSPLKYSKPNVINRNLNTFYTNMSSIGTPAYSRSFYSGLVVDTLL